MAEGKVGSPSAVDRFHRPWIHLRGADIDTAAAARAAAEYHAARKAVIMSDGFLMGGQLGTISYFAQLDSGRTTLTILGRSFPLPTADSALVVLVDRADGVGGAPTIAGTAVIDGRFPADPVPKTWTSGDTIFTIRVPDRGNENLRMVLGRNPMAAAFWR